MTPLDTKISALIRANGPIRLDRFWNVALYDPEEGYYTRGRPIGRHGDFTTAPEISQMFGELIGAWIIAAWRELGEPSPFLLAEIGPGRGTLIADMVRTVIKVSPACIRAARVRLIEVSDRLAAEQLRALERFDLPVRRVKAVDELEAYPMVLLGNEIFDALAIRQFTFDGNTWRERLIGESEDGRAEGFRFVEGDPEPSLAAALRGAQPEPGEVFEWSPSREALAARIGRRISQTGGAALFFDYGHARSGFGDTLQAVRGHAFAAPLEDAGASDITSHVDFSRLAKTFAGEGLAVSKIVTQSETLLSLGLIERAGALGANLDEAGRDEIRIAVRRLAGTQEGEMGSLFKALAAASRPLSLPPFAS